jgi:hypothetical protein
MFDIMRLHAELQRNRVEAGLEKEDSITPRTARLERQLDEDIEYFVKIGIDNPYYIARELGKHPTTIKMRLGSVIRKLERPNDIDIIRGTAFSSGGYVGITQR